MSVQKDAAASPLYAPDGTELPVDRETLRQIAETGDGQKLRRMAQNSAPVQDALRRGDAASLRAALGEILKTPEGARIAQTLRKIAEK